MEKCCCDCCSCFFSSSAQPPPNNNASPAVAIEEAPNLTRKGPKTPPAIQEAPNLRRKDSHDASSSAESSSSAQPPPNNNASPAVAIEEAPDLRRKDPQTPPARQEAPNLRRKDSHDASSSAESSSSAQPPPNNNASPAVAIQEAPNISEDATAADGQNDNINLDGLIEDMFQLLKINQTKSSDKRPSTDHYWPRSTIFCKLKEILSEATDGALALKGTSSSQNSSEAMKVVQDLVAGIGHAHWAAAGLLVVANILERFEAIRANRDECLSLLEEMISLAKHVKDLKERPSLKKGMEVSIKKATNMIVEGALMCRTQTNSSMISRFFSTSVNKDKLTKFQQKLQKMYKRMNDQMLICIFDAIECRNMRPQIKHRERSYPQNAVGIEEPLEEVIELLDWENDKNAVAVILHGLGGMGKSTLADAVFARLYIEDCKYSMVRLFENIGSTPNVVDLQKTILKDLSTGTEEEEIPGSEGEIRTFEDGQRAIGHVLEKRVAFIYIDNVFRDPNHSTDPLEQLLPRDFINAKKVRLLVTARNQDVVRGCRMEAFKFYPMKYLPEPEAMNVLNQELWDSAREDLKSDQLSEIVNICGGIPKLLTVIAGFIRSEEDKQVAYSIVMEEKNKWKGQIGDDIECYLFAYDRIPEMEQESFLDICSFFIGWPWNKVQNIVGMSNLNMLRKRSLVMKDERMTVNVHDVILTIARQKADGTRFKFSRDSYGILNSIADFHRHKLSAQSDFNNFSKKDIQGIKGLWFDYDYLNFFLPDIFYITSKKLDSMCNSLKILSLGDLVKVDGDCENIFEKLIFFKGGVPYPFNMSQSKELRYLECQPQDLNFLTQVPSNLKHMKLDGKLHSEDAFEISSSDLQQLRNLQTLELISFVGLKQLPEGLGDLIKDLQELNLSDCISIEKLPRSISTLQSLKILIMRNCLSLKGLPENFESLKSLTKLKLTGCKSLTVLLSNLDKLIELRSLDLSQWINVLNDLPQSERDKVDTTFISLVQEFCEKSLVQGKSFLYLVERHYYALQKLRQNVKSEWMKEQRIGDVSTKVTRAILSCIFHDDTLKKLNLIL